MKSQAEHHPIVVTILIVLMVFLGLGGIGGGLAMMSDPSGDLLGLPLVLLNDLTIRTYLLPGLFLFLVMGILPLVVAYGLWERHARAWSATIGLSILLILWIGLQIYLWGPPIAIQIVYLVLGVVMLGLCLLPAVKSHFRGFPP